MTPDRIALVARLDAQTVMHDVALLESRGLLQRYPDGRYGPCGAS
jgi:hypothetical protein